MNTAEKQRPYRVVMDDSGRFESLSAIDMAVLAVLIHNAGRVISRETLTRMAGIESESVRRVDVSLVAIRRVLGPDSLRTVRQRGWILTDVGVTTARIALGGALDISE